LSVLGPQDFACLREAASAKAGEPWIWAFLSSPKKSPFQQHVRLGDCLLGIGTYLELEIW
jgi:hypothetical protein